MAKTDRSPAEALIQHLRERGLAKYPGAHLKSPWPGHLDLAVKDKTFAYLSVDGPPSISCKLPQSSEIALLLPNAKPTGYGLGKSGWVSLDLDPSDLPPTDMLEAWIDESYRAQAPKKLVAQLDAASGAPAEPAPKKAPAKKSAKKAPAKKVASAKRAPKNHV